MPPWEGYNGQYNKQRKNTRKWKEKQKQKIPSKKNGLATHQARLDFFHTMRITTKGKKKGNRNTTVTFRAAAEVGGTSSLTSSTY